MGGADWESRFAAAPESWRNFPTHRDDAAIWLFSGGTTGRPKAAVQPHRSFVNTAQCYAGQVLRYTEDDVTLSVPKLYFGYATGSNLLFPFAAGATSALFEDRCTAEVLFSRIARYRPTILITVPTMINQMVSHPEAGSPGLSPRCAWPPPPARRCRRSCTAGGTRCFGVELLDGLGTAEMWHIFLSNRVGRVRPGTLGQVVPGFEIKVARRGGRHVPDGTVGPSLGARRVTRPGLLAATAARR